MHIFILLSLIPSITKLIKQWPIELKNEKIDVICIREYANISEILSMNAWISDMNHTINL